MRPVNLIPADERRGQGAPLRSGPIAYVVLAALVALLVGVTLVVLANNRIADRKSELAQVEREDSAASARAAHLSPYTQYQLLSEQRAETVKSLADSRFDWERVMGELSLILPDNVWLTQLSASASSGSSVGGDSGGEEGGGLRGEVAGPALQVSGCASGQGGVADFVGALKDIDGVTRVGVESSALPPTGTAAGTGGGEGSSNCRTRDFIAEFKIVVAFDAAPVPSTEGEVAVATTEPAPPESEEPPTEPSEG